ncbi:hypothetical protein [Exiguobacterium flavidum]|uniref:hypothetical protein n=1 Tax=Exiguobacterium flavidum TaxID=2184695 RepID=UPI000DF7BFE9|nr:hypothetical protein [Exiguobacterium flavidum]
MNYLQLGQFSIPITWLAALLALVPVSLTYRFLFRRKLQDWFMNSFLLYFLIWKFSYALFNLDLVLEMPASLAFFHGGLKGQLLATAGLAVYWGSLSAKGRLERDMVPVIVLYLYSFELLFNLLESNWGLSAIHMILLAFTISIFFAMKQTESSLEWGIALVLLLLIVLSLTSDSVIDEAFVYLSLLFATLAATYIPKWIGGKNEVE